MIDYLTLLLVNMAVGFFLLAWYLWWGIDDADQRRWAPAFLVTGLLGFLFGLHMTVTWPLRGSYNIVFGEMSVFFGAIFLGAGLALAFRWSLLMIALYAVLPGLAAMVIGARIIDLGLTSSPWLAGIGFILSGIAAVSAAPALYLVQRFPTIRWLNLGTRWLGILVLVAAGLIWIFIGLGAYWTHLERFSDWVPFSLRE
ncbi:MAG: DUF981 family protein [Armatimonadota bacterium]